MKAQLWGWSKKAGWGWKRRCWKGGEWGKRFICFTILTLSLSLLEAGDMRVDVCRCEPQTSGIAPPWCVPMIMKDGVPGSCLFQVILRDTWTWQGALLAMQMPAWFSSEDSCSRSCSLCYLQLMELSFPNRLHVQHTDSKNAIWSVNFVLWTWPLPVSLCITQSWTRICCLPWHTHT